MSTSDFYEDLNTEIRKVAYGWFRGNDNTDLSYSGDFSIGEILAPLLRHAFCSIHFFSNSFSSELIERNSSVSSPSKISGLVLKNLGLTEAAINTDLYYQLDETVITPSHIPTFRFALLIRLMQWPFKKLIRRRKTLWISDHISKVIALGDKGGLVLFRKSFLNGVTTFRRLKYIRKFDAEISLVLDRELVEKLFFECLGRENINWTSGETKLCIDYLISTYVDIRPALVDSASLWEELLDSYQPEKCCLPSDSNPIWLTLLMICKARGIKTVSYLDGYPVVPWLPISLDKSGNDWLLDEVAAYDDRHKQGIAELGYPEKRIVSPTVFPFMSGKSEQQKTFDFIVMSYWVDIFSSTSDCSSPPETLREILSVLAESKPTRVGVKIKHEPERQYIEVISKEFDFTVEILEGRFKDFVRKTDCVIGGFSTALMESQVNGTRYLIYEPPANGYTDDWISRSHVVKKEDVLRSPRELAESIYANSII